MGLNSLLQERLGKGEFISSTPVIIETVPGQLDSVIRSLERAGQRIRDQRIREEIPRFNMVAGRFLNSRIERLADDPRVVIIYFDDAVPIPTQPEVEESGLMSMATSAGLIPSIPGKPLFRLGLRPQDLLHQAQFALSRIRPSSAKAGWIPTSTVRTIVGADAARAAGIEGRGVKVAVIDTGVPAPVFIRRQPQLRGRVQRFGLTIIPQPDRSGHGTLVSSILAGLEWRAPNGLLLEGIAPEVELASVKVLQTRRGLGRQSDVIKGVAIADEWGAKVMNLSLGSDTYVQDSPFEGPFQQLVAREVIIVVAAGNTGPDPSTVGTPGGSPWAWTVGAVDTMRRVSRFSSRGPAGALVKPDLAAPGGDDFTREAIVSTTSIGSAMDALDGRPADGLSAALGTSFAAPAVAGVVALWDEWVRRNRGRRLTNADILRMGQMHSRTKDNAVGFGVPRFNWTSVL